MTEDTESTDETAVQHDDQTVDATDASTLSRRAALTALGVAGLFGLGTGTASADPQGQVGTSGDPLNGLYTDNLYGNNGAISVQNAIDFANSDSIRDAGTDVIKFDGNQNVTISNGDLDLSGNALTDSSSGSLTVQSSTDNGLRLNTDGGKRALELGTPTADKKTAVEAGGNVIAGHPRNTVNNDAVGVVVGGGGGKEIEKTVGGDFATVGGGRANKALGENATVAGGHRLIADGDRSTVSGGYDNQTSASHATIPGGSRNRASGYNSFAFGQYAAAEDDFAFVWSDATPHHNAYPNDVDDGLSSSEAVNGEPEAAYGANSWSVSATGGVRFITGEDSVTYIEGGAAGWSTTSSRTAKTNISPVDAQRVLDGVTEMEVATWEYEGNDGEGKGTRYVGPMAEDFHDVVDVGTGDGSINSINADGLAFAAIQGLAERLAEKDERIDDLEAENDRLRERLNAIEEQLGINDQADQQGVADD